jgi:pimeloyl-ACP methyl ester carboxylesterase
VEARLTQLRVPALVVMGDQDPDFSDPAAEAAWIASTLSGAVVMVPEAGHYPQSQQPEIVSAAVIAFLAQAARRG